MKSFSSSSFASGHTEALDLATRSRAAGPSGPVHRFPVVPLRGQGRHLFHRLSKSPFDKEMLKDLVAKVVSLARN